MRTSPHIVQTQKSPNSQLQNENKLKQLQRGKSRKKDKF
jgi:hypothetical protein